MLLFLNVAPLVIIASGTVYFSAVLSNGNNQSTNFMKVLTEQEVPELRTIEIISIPVTSSLMLLALFFYFEYLQYFLGKSSI